MGVGDVACLLLRQQACIDQQHKTAFASGMAALRSSQRTCGLRQLIYEGLTWQHDQEHQWRCRRPAAGRWPAAGLTLSPQPLRLKGSTE